MLANGVGASDSFFNEIELLLVLLQILVSSRRELGQTSPDFLI